MLLMTCSSSAFAQPYTLLNFAINEWEASVAVVESVRHGGRLCSDMDAGCVPNVKFSIVQMFPDSQFWTSMVALLHGFGSQLPLREF